MHGPPPCWPRPGRSQSRQESPSAGGYGHSGACASWVSILSGSQREQVWEIAITPPDAKGWMQPGDLRRPPGIGGVAAGPGLCPRLQEVRRSQRVMRPAGPGPPSGDCKTGNTHFWRGYGGETNCRRCQGPPSLRPPRPGQTPLWPFSPGVYAEGEKFRPSHLQRGWGWGRATRPLSFLLVPES